MQNFIVNILTIVILSIIQVFFLDRLPFTPYIHISIYLAYIVFLPIKTSPFLIIIYSAILGLLIDILNGQMGVTMAAATAAGYARVLLLNGLYTNKRIKADSRLHPKNIDLSKFILYCLILSITNSIVGSLCESGLFTFTNKIALFRLLISISITTIILTLSSIFISKKSKSSF